MRVFINLEEKHEMVMAIKLILEKNLVSEDQKEHFINIFNKLLTMKKGDKIEIIQK